MRILNRSHWGGTAYVFGKLYWATVVPLLIVSDWV